ncbi:MAG: hypothetical protein KDD99_24915, partial [Bacteroidetes bacterium]|nr:hypothetical protein [Bacteroidota bacterium]
AITAFEESASIHRSFSGMNLPLFELDKASLMNHLGASYLALRQFDKAFETTREAQIFISQLANETPSLYWQELAYNYYNLASIFRQKIHFTQARMYYHKADSVYALYPENSVSVSWRPYIKEEVDLLSSQEELAHLLSNRGIDFYESKQNDSARYYWQESIRVYENIPPNSAQVNISYNLSVVHENLSFLETDPSKQFETMQKVVLYRETALTKEPDDIEIKTKLVEALYDLSWLGLFANAFEESEKAARRVLVLSPESTGVITNLASALLFSGRFSDAETYYLEWKDKPWISDSAQTFGDIFLADLKELEEAGVTHPDMKKARKLLKK